MNYSTEVKSCQEKFAFYFYLVIIAQLLFFLAIGCADIIDTYTENFNSRKDGVSISGIDSWEITEGDENKAIIQSSETITGTGNALKLAGDKTIVKLNRKTTYGNLTPAWIEFNVKPGIGSQRKDVPSTGIASVTFDYSGKIFASDGTSWVDTERTYEADEWYRVLLKLDFSRHLYDLYIFSATTPEVEFIPVKRELEFIDDSINSLSELGFNGVYSTVRTDDSFIDDIVVNFIDRLEIITPGQTLVEDEPSQLIIVQLQNALSEPQTAWEDITLELKSSSPKGSFSLSREGWKPITTLILPQNSQTASFYYKDAMSGKAIITAKEYPDRGWEEASQEVSVVKEAAFFDVAVTSPQAAGEEFTITILAKDDRGNVNESYSADIEIIAEYVSPERGAKKITPQNASGFNKGKLTLNASYPDCGIINVVIEDMADSSKMGRSGNILFIPDSFGIFLEDTQIVRKEFPLEIKAFNKQGKIAPNYKGPARLSVAAVTPENTDGGELLPSLINPPDFSEGEASLNATYNRWGKIKIKVEDLSYPGRVGISGVIDFNPANLKVNVKFPASNRNFFYAGETISIELLVLNSIGEVIPNYGGLINISSSPGLGLPQICQIADAGRHTFLTSVKSSGTYEAGFEEKSAKIAAKTVPITVKEAIIEVISAYAPVGEAEIIIKLVDENGQIIKSENEMPVNITLKEEIDNGSAVSKTTQIPVNFVNGIAKVIVFDTEAEVVTVSPFSKLDFKTRKGTVTFGRITKKGIGTLMWREIKK